ncbi:DUF72 domain-containing protein [Kiritimatiella glycovorans]|uniref:DUF72 domain-containing protein n=1 Tax=Kiritimatiella glycovorans TaxID=1307763 RepID=A0A0G3EFH3_9BACT|nr:DUF72 domain-containing protein [Kiritimatiella glycovorans]AKJ65098.1 hypothetical protein L21SP4_01861 [Kiritimatiella glycovorans]
MPRRNKGANWFVGTSGWTYDHWQGIFYPDDLPKSRRFEFYASVFNAVEVNATFYRRFRDSTYEKWRDRVPEGFAYVMKAPRLITHRKYLRDCDDLIDEFRRSVHILGDRLGLILLQLPPKMPYEPDRLGHVLERFDMPGRICVEFRHERWMRDEITQRLDEAGAVSCSVDSPDMRPSGLLTGGKGYVRLHGRRSWYDDKYEEKELKEIAELARDYADRGAEEVYIFFNNDAHGYAPTEAQRVQTLLR